MHSMKILLINLPIDKGYISLPLGLASIAAYVEENGNKVKIIDSLALNYSNKDIEKQIKKFDPDIVGMGCTTRYVFETYNLFKIIKKINPNCLTVVGGPHPSVLPEEVLKECPFIDVVVRGEGEVTFSELVDKFEKNQGFEDVLGISFRKDDRIISNSNRPLIEDLDSLPLPAYHLLPMDKYQCQYKVFNFLIPIGQLRSSGSISTSRGCPYDCIFCSSSMIWGKKFRMKTPSKVIEQIKILSDKYNMKYIDIIDDTFTVNKNRVLEICNLIKKENIDIIWSCITRVELFDQELASLLKSSGCNKIFFGFESGSQKILDLLNKRFTINDSIKAVEIANNNEIKVVGSFIIGIPGETKETIKQTIQFAKKLKLDYGRFQLLTPLPGTKIYEYAMENNLILTKDWSKYTYLNSVMKIPGISLIELKILLWRANKLLS